MHIRVPRAPREDRRFHRLRPHLALERRHVKNCSKVRFDNDSTEAELVESLNFSLESLTGGADAHEQVGAALTLDRHAVLESDDRIIARREVLVLDRDSDYASVLRVPGWQAREAERSLLARVDRDRERAGVGHFRDVGFELDFQGHRSAPSG